MQSGGTQDTVDIQNGSVELNNVVAGVGKKNIQPKAKLKLKKQKKVSKKRR